MRRSHLPRVAHAAHHHVRFRTKLRHALHHVSRETGEPIHKLEAKVMKEYNKLSPSERYSFEEGVLIGGVTSTLLTIGAFVPAVLPAMAIPFGITAGVRLREDVQRRREREQLEAMR